MTSHRGYGQPLERPLTPNIPGTDAGKLLFVYTTHQSGPIVAGDPTNMATNGASLEAPSIFEFRCPVNTQLRVARLNFSIVAPNPALSKFGSIAALANGCLLDIVEPNGLSILDMTARRPFKSNADFLSLAGTDVIINTGPGLDVVKMRLNLLGLGLGVILKDGQSIRWTIQDTLAGIDFPIDEFRCQIQGTMFV